ncbi:bioF [Wigglesworthia glossinidia endosymbiont of Glossina brevipalpis]|uniref:BioF protein n=1 Tax=Wigglesworthia glossinidia brevipalpis TaxID=36870 RepID=Q8D2A0_WIGBR|nr:bioF [Wigglesworthia glossinidia endosymbiont of Glossina brevipalpis]
MLNMKNILQNKVQKDLLNIKSKNIYRKRTPVKDGNSRYIFINNKKYLNFSSNNYLGLSCDTDIKKSWCNFINIEGMGSGGSGHVIGYSELHKKLEVWLAKWMGFPRALLFSSGFLANQAIVNVLGKLCNNIIVDKFIHASIIESAINSKMKLQRFKHNDMTSLEKCLMKKKHNESCLIFTEGIFSMDGDQCNLQKILNISNKFNGYLVLDDAHGFGILGSEGRGTIKIENVYPDLLVITFSKSVGINGAAILCQKEIAEYFLQYSRNLIYSTSMPPSQAGAILTAIKKIKKSNFLRKRLFNNIKKFKKKAKELKFYKKSNTAIQPIITNDNRLTIKFFKKLVNFGIWACPILPPSVPVKKSRIRIIITAMHNENDIDILLQSLFKIEKINEHGRL